MTAICAANVVIYSLVKTYYVWRNKIRENYWANLSEDVSHFMEPPLAVDVLTKHASNACVISKRPQILEAGAGTSDSRTESLDNYWAAIMASLGDWIFALLPDV